jgi:hypothetical protein
VGFLLPLAVKDLVLEQRAVGRRVWEVSPPEKDASMARDFSPFASDAGCRLEGLYDVKVDPKWGARGSREWVLE